VRNEPLRNPDIALELERAVARGSYDQLFALFCRFSGLPGPRANMRLASAVGQAVAAYGSRADRLVTALRSVSRERGSEKGPREFLPIVGAFCLAARFDVGTEPDAALAELRTLAEDPRHLIREGVAHALGEVAPMRGDELVRLLGKWTDGYLSAAVALEAISARSWLDALRTPDEAVSRLDESFSLVENAPRADQRSQGYRTLMITLPAACAKILDRFPEATVRWLEARAATDHVELREALGALASRARGHTVGELERFGQILQENAPPRRDPKTYVGPTRKRGARRR
jgi:hypothetical protein